MIRRLGHLLARGHWPEDFWLGPFLKCAICTVGTPRGPRITPPLTIRQREFFGGRA